MLRNAGQPLLDSALLDLGKTVEIHLGYGNDLKPAFLGEIAAIEPSFPQTDRRRSRCPATTSRTGCAAPSREPTAYEFINDSVIAAQIAVENGLDPGGRPDARAIAEDRSRSRATWPS